MTTKLGKNMGYIMIFKKNRKTGELELTKVKVIGITSGSLSDYKSYIVPMFVYIDESTGKVGYSPCDGKILTGPISEK